MTTFSTFLKNLAFSFVLIMPVFSQGATLDFKARCNLNSPVVRVQLSADPRSEITCQVKANKTFLALTNSIQLTIGEQTYNVIKEWQTFEENCQTALALFAKHPELYATDPEVGSRLMILADSEYKEISISRGLERDACKGRL